MNRRNSLLGSLSPSSGGKKVNHGVAIVEQRMKVGDITLEFEFPCVSTINVIAHTNLRDFQFGVLQGNNYSESEFMGQFMSLSFSPQEDDTYIYEVVIEQ